MSTPYHFIRDIGNYLIGRGSIILLGFITFPLLTRLLPVNEYGIVSLTFRLILLLVVLSKCGLQYSATRFYNATRSDLSAQQTFHSTLLLCPALISVAVSGVYVLVLYQSKGLRQDSLPFDCLLLAPIAVVIRTLQSMLLSFLRNEGRSRAHTVIEVLTKTTTVIAFAALAIAGARNALLVLTLTMLGEAAVVAAQLIAILRKGLIRLSAVDWQLIRKSVIFGAPLIVYELSSIFLDSADRFIVQHYLGDHKLGLYSAAYGLSGYLQDTVMTPLNLALFPIYMRIWHERGKAETSRFLSTALSWFLVIAFFIVGASLLSSKDALILLASRRFSGAEGLLAILIPALMIYALHIFFNVGLVLENRTTALALVALGAAGINIATNIFLVPRIGLSGAAIATLISYVAMVLSLWTINQNILPLRPHTSLVLGGLFAMLCSVPVPLLIQSKWPAVVVLARTALYAAVFSLCLRMFSGESREAFRKVYGRLLPGRRTFSLPLAHAAPAATRGGAE